MPPRNDIWRVGDIRWDESLWVDACKIDYIVELIDGGIKIHLKKEENMNKNKLLKDVDRIIIDKSYDGKTVTAVAQKRTTEEGSPFFPCMIDVAKASATCGPNDIFDFNIVAKLALDRLYEGYDMTPKPKRKPYNGKIFIRCGNECNVLKNSRIYNVLNGFIINDYKKRVAGSTCTEPYIFEGMSEDELSDVVDINIFYGVHYSGYKDPRRHYTAYFVKE